MKRLYLSPHLSEIGTLRRKPQVVGRHRVGPSATLDKILFYWLQYITFLSKVQLLFTKFIYFFPFISGESGL